MVKVIRPPHGFKRSRSVFKTACCVFSVYDDWVNHLAMKHHREMQRHFFLQQHFGDDYALKHQRAMQQEYDLERYFQDDSSNSSISDCEHEKSDDEEEDPALFTELPQREEDDTFGDLRHFLQRQEQRAEMEKAYGQRFEAPDAFAQAQRDRFFTPVPFEQAPPMTQLLAAGAPASPRRRQY